MWPAMDLVNREVFSHAQNGVKREMKKKIRTKKCEGEEKKKKKGKEERRKKEKEREIL